MADRIFTNEAIPESPTWTSGTLPLSFRPEGTGWSRLARCVANVYRSGARIRPEDLLILTNTHNLSASLLGIWHNLKGERPTLVRTEPHLPVPGHGPRGRLKRTFLHGAYRQVDHLVTWAPAVRDRYHQAWGIPLERMTAVRFHHTLRNYEFGPIRTGDYIFSGGDSMRDYGTLLEAARGLPIRFVIATRAKVPGDRQVPDNVTIGPVSHAAFRERMAGARLVVFPLRTDQIRTSGQQSYLNAMALGKAVIVTDPVDASFYIDDRRTGRLTPSGDSSALRQALKELLDDPGACREMGERAREFARPLDQERTWSEVMRIALERHRIRLGRYPRGSSADFSSPGKDLRPPEVGAE